MVYSLFFSPPFLSSPLPLFTTTHPSFPLPSLPRPLSVSSPFLFPSSLFLSSPFPSSLFSFSLPSRLPYFPFLSLLVLPIFPFSPFSSSLLFRDSEGRPQPGCNEGVCQNIILNLPDGRVKCVLLLFHFIVSCVMQLIISSVHIWSLGYFSQFNH